MVLADLIRLRAERRPELDVLTFERFSPDGGAAPDEVRTYAGLAENANRIAAALVARGVAPGDRFAIAAPNCPEFVEAMIAASIAGAVFVPIDPRTRAAQLAFLLRRSGCVGAICAAEALPALAAARPEAPELRFVLALEPAAPGAGAGVPPGVEWLREALESPAPTLDVRADGPLAPLQIMYTSGTTGDPKGIVGTNLRFCASQALGTLFGYRPDERPYTGLSFTHGNAQAVTLAPALFQGLRAVISRRFTKSRLWDVCRRHGVTTFSLVGGMATAIYGEAPRPDDADNPVRMLVSGGMPPPIWEAFEKRFGVRILEFYGAMDGGGMAWKPIGEGPVGSFGKPMPGIEMRILDEGGNECPPGALGEICVRPAGGDASVEYHGDPEASRRKIRGGWNRSGDVGWRDADGWLFFSHRVGGGIRRNGEFVQSGRIEKAIAELAGVSDVFVYGVPAASGAPGEQDVVAAVVFADGAARDVAAVFRGCRARLEPHCVPSWIQVLDEIPKTASEKPQERILRERFSPAADGVWSEPAAGEAR
jgi:crotonobetaine/carnitine-CoA ligase